MDCFNLHKVKYFKYLNIYFEFIPNPKMLKYCFFIYKKIWEEIAKKFRGKKFQTVPAGKS